jgi:hypothetical protein
MATHHIAAEINGYVGRHRVVAVVTAIEQGY